VTDFLHLSSLIVLGVQESDQDYHVSVETKKKPRACHACGAIDLVGFGRKEQVFLDVPAHGKRVGIHLDRRRYRCKSCGVTMLEPLSMMDEKRAMTTRLVRYVQEQSLKRTFTSAAEDIGVDEKTVRNIFRDHVRVLEATYQFQTPRVLGIDEIHLMRPRCVLSNVEERAVFNILVNRNKGTVERYLLHLPDRREVELVAMDMWTPYRDACQLALPWATVIVDKFHVVRMASQAVDDVRKSIRDDMSLKQRRGLMHDRFILLKRNRDLTDRERMLLELWTGSIPDLGLAYDLKERFYDLWDTGDK
jgi:transposase